MDVYVVECSISVLQSLEPVGNLQMVINDWIASWACTVWKNYMTHALKMWPPAELSLTHQQIILCDGVYTCSRAQ